MPRASGTRPENVVAYVAANVRRLRVAGHLTQEGLAETAGLSAIHLRRIEAGKADLRVTMLVRLAVALGCEPWRLLRPAAPVERRAGRPPARAIRGRARGA